MSTTEPETDHRGAGRQGRHFTGPDLPSRADLQNCIHCGFCLPSCPTYVATGEELESPRGRLHLISSVLEGRIEASDRVLGHLDLCLQCRACETACPSAVPYGRIMEDARASILANPPGHQPRSWRLRALGLRRLLANPPALRASLALGRLYTRSGLQRLVRGPLRALLPGPLARIESSLPALERAPYRATGTLARPLKPEARVALLLGCIHGELYPRMHEATVRVLEHVGCEVVAPPAQVCCGALHTHAGDAETARALARRNIAAFEPAGVEAVIVNAAGCGAAMKEYGRLLRHDERWAERAERFAAQVRDVAEFVAQRDFARSLGRVERIVTLQDACHLAHAQRIREAPRAILRAIPGLELREMRTPDRCCGSAGIYSLVQPSMSAQVLEAKMTDVQRALAHRGHGAPPGDRGPAPSPAHPEPVEGEAGAGRAAIATGNPGCTLQLQAGCRRTGLDAEVLHVIELLDEAIAAGVRER